MIRLLLVFSIKWKLSLQEIDFRELTNWTSEGLLSSPFIKIEKEKVKNKNDNKRREGYTHADIAFGDFSVNYSDQGKIKVNRDAKIFGIIESKMKSNLSQETVNCKNYNQISRSVVCIASNIPNNFCKSFFVLVSPEKSPHIKIFNQQVNKELILKQVKERFNYYTDEFKNENNYLLVLKRINDMSVFKTSFEEWINLIPDETDKKNLYAYYTKCLLHNRI